MGLAEKRAELKRRNEAALAGGGPERLRRQREAGKLSARERLDLLLDEGSFEELDRLAAHDCTDFGMADRKIPGDGFVTGYGCINGRTVYAFAHDFTVFGGSLSLQNAKKICKLQDLALKTGAPVIGLNDSGGARIHEGVASLAGYAEIFLRNTIASGVVPQISAVMGPCAGGAVYSPAITDFVFMVGGTSHMFVTGPDVIRTVTHEEVSKEDLGGARTHNETSGVAHFLAADDAHCLQMIRELHSYLPSNNLDDPPLVPTGDPADRVDPALDEIVPAEPDLPYDVKRIVTRVVDDGSFFEVQEHFAQNIVVGFARLDGRAVGVVANPAGRAGGLPGHRRLPKRRAVRPLLRRLQHPDHHLRGRARLPARHRPGVRRHHQARGEAALRLLRGDRAEGHGDHTQGLWRRLLRDGLQARPDGHQLRLPDRGDRGDGSRGRRQHPVPPGTRVVGRPGELPAV